MSRAQPRSGHLPSGFSWLGQSDSAVNSIRNSVRFGRLSSCTATEEEVGRAAAPIRLLAIDRPSICGGTVSPVAERQPASSKKVGAMSTLP